MKKVRRQRDNLQTLSCVLPDFAHLRLYSIATKPRRRLSMFAMGLWRWIAIAALLLLAALPLTAQVDPEYVIPKTNPNTAPADLARGEQLFKGQCAGCHGPKGEGGRGAVLAQPRLRRATDDESLFRTIRDGIRGAEMPGADTITSREIWQIAGYVRSLGRLPVETVAGDPKRGENIYKTKGNCAQCHIVAGEGSSFGPELTEIGARRGAARLRSAVLDPESVVPESFLQVRLVTKDGRRIMGVRLNEDTFTTQIRDLD